MKLDAHPKPAMPPRGPAASSRRIPELDGLRGMAILLVLVFHYLTLQIHFQPTGILRALAPGLGLAWSGVDLFFVLSGFLIGGILMDQRESPNYFSNFYRRRFWRIVPIYAVVCGAFWFFAFAFHSNWLFQPALPWYYYATFTQNIGMALAGGWFGANWLGVTWSLAVEEQFYLVAPLALRWLRSSFVPILVGGAILLSLLLRILCGSLFQPIFPHPALTAYVMMPCHLDGLAVGVLVAWLVRNQPAVAWLKGKRWFLLAVILASAAGLWRANAQSWQVFSPQMTLIGYTWLAFFYGLVLVYALFYTDGVLGRILRFSPLRGLGIISYGVYLLHQPVSGLCYGMLTSHDEPGFRNLPETGITLLALALTLSLAALSWRYFEQPLLSRGRPHRPIPSIA
ncbi:MAG: hypothetical protein JWQ04_2161 [Pedosphaera sp.]|nr:hypothetical protein [Pedosphaera sp.]